MIGQQAYIKNVGSTQTFIKNPNEKERFNDIHWEADYDGNQANIHLNIDDNGNNAEIRANLNNNDLAQLLNMPAIRGNLDERLYNDFHNPLNPLNPLLEKVEQKPVNPLNPLNPLFPKVEQKPPVFIKPLLLEQNPRLIIRHEKVHPKLKYQPFLRPQKTRRVKYNKLVNRLKEPTRINLVGKPAALKYRTPLPKTMRIHLTSPTEFASKGDSRASGTKRSRSKRTSRRSKRTRSKSSSRINLFRNLF